jgi:hypothetical protein
MAKVWIWLEILIKRLEAFNYLQLNTDKNSNDMKDKLTQISDDLNHDVITEKEAKEQLLILCGVGNSTEY